MPWLQIKFDVNAASAESFSDLLSESGAAAVTMVDAEDQPILEPEPGTTPLWDAVQIIAMYAEQSNPAQILQQLKVMLPNQALPLHQVEILEDQDWERVWMSRFQPMKFGEHLWIRPSWSDMTLSAQDVVVDLDPGLAFGTGTHETTAQCLAWLDAAELQNRTCIDYGCGSGVLAIAAVKLGAARVLATDIDEQALTATRTNAEANHVQHRIDLMRPADLPDTPVDLVMANILAGPLLELAPELAGLVRGGGRIVLSGILLEQVPELLDCYQRWFAMEAAQSLGNWGLLSGTRIST